MSLIKSPSLLHYAGESLILFCAEAMKPNLARAEVPKSLGEYLRQPTVTMWSCVSVPSLPTMGYQADSSCNPGSHFLQD